MHPASAGLEAPKGRKVFVIGGPFGQPLPTRGAGFYRPFGAGRFINRYLGLKPQAESCSPFGTKSDSIYGTNNTDAHGNNRTSTGWRTFTVLTPPPSRAVDVVAPSGRTSVAVNDSRVL
jgi:hypothetical protein